MKKVNISPQFVILNSTSVADKTLQLHACPLLAAPGPVSNLLQSGAEANHVTVCWDPPTINPRCTFDYEFAKSYRPNRKQGNFHYTVPKIEFMFSRKRNCVVSVPIPTFMCLWAIYIFPGLVHIFGCSIIDRPILEIYKSLTDIWARELGGRTL